MKVQMKAWVGFLMVSAALGVAGVGMGAGCSLNVDDLGSIVDQARSDGEGDDESEGEAEGEGEGDDEGDGDGEGEGDAGDCHAAVDDCELVTGTFCEREAECGVETFEECLGRISFGLQCAKTRIELRDPSPCVDVLESETCEALTDADKQDACDLPLFAFGDTCD